MLLLVSAGLTAFCVLWSWCPLIVLCGFGPVSAGLAPVASLCSSVLFWVGLGWSRCVCVVLCGFLLVCAGLTAFVWFCVVLSGFTAGVKMAR